MYKCYFFYRGFFTWDRGTSRETASNRQAQCMKNNRKEVVDSRNRDKIKLHVRHISSNEDIADTFGWFIEDIRDKKCPRTLIFCKGKDVSPTGLINATMLRILSPAYYHNETISLINIYHKDTLDTTKA